MIRLKVQLLFIHSLDSSDCYQKVKKNINAINFIVPVLKEYNVKNINFNLGFCQRFPDLQTIKYFDSRCNINFYHLKAENMKKKRPIIIVI